jgi:hypothetical protein
MRHAWCGRLSGYNNDKKIALGDVDRRVTEANFAPLLHCIKGTCRFYFKRAIVCHVLIICHVSCIEYVLNRTKTRLNNIVNLLSYL